MERMGKGRVGVALLLIFSVQGAFLPCTAISNPLNQPSVEAPASDTDVLTTYQKFLPRALDNDPDIQYLLGYMFLHGEGVENDYDQAHQWLHLAAAGGHRVAQRILGNFHGRMLHGVPDYFHDPAESDQWLGRAPALAGFEVSNRVQSQTLKLGESVFSAFCAGCHGFNGIAYYVDSPSFALGEQLHKSDDELLKTLKTGKGEMPNWDDKLSEAELRAAISYIRTLAPAYKKGISHEYRQAAQTYFVFKTLKKKGVKVAPESPPERETVNR